MRWIVVVLSMALVFSSAVHTQNNASQPVGRPEVGKAVMRSNDQRCDRCHGIDGEGAFGPDLAGRGLNLAQFTRAVRQPWGLMPSFTPNQISDQMLADIHAYFESLPKVSSPGPWREAVPEGASHAQRLYMETAMCGQCHGPEAVGQPRHLAGGAGGDFEWFKKTVYEHSSLWPAGHMPNYSRSRLPESLLKEIWQYMSVDLGLLADVRASADRGVATGGSVGYTVNVQNFGVVGKGLAAEDISVSLVLPAGASVVNSTGAGYQGVRRDPKLGADLAVWLVARIAAAERQTFTLTLSGSGAAAGLSRGSTVSWARPVVREGFPNTVTRNDSVNVTIRVPPASR